MRPDAPGECVAWPGAMVRVAMDAEVLPPRPADEIERNAEALRLAIKDRHPTAVFSVPMAQDAVAALYGYLIEHGYTNPTQAVGPAA